MVRPRRWQGRSPLVIRALTAVCDIEYRSAKSGTVAQLHEFVFVQRLLTFALGHHFGFSQLQLERGAAVSRGAQGSGLNLGSLADAALFPLVEVDDCRVTGGFLFDIAFWLWLRVFWGL